MLVARGPRHSRGQVATRDPRGPSQQKVDSAPCAADGRISAAVQRMCSSKLDEGASAIGGLPISDAEREDGATTSSARLHVSQLCAASNASGLHVAFVWLLYLAMYSSSY